MISMLELLEDVNYKRFLQTVPQLPAVDRLTPQWRLYVRMKGESKWRRREFDTYAQMFKFFKRLYKAGKVADAALNHKGIAFGAPTRVVRVKGKYVKGVQVTKEITWKPKLPGDEIQEHHWCPYCRRPTVFEYFTKHHALGKANIYIDPSVPRCCICGASARLLNMRY